MRRRGLQTWRRVLGSSRRHLLEVDTNLTETKLVELSLAPPQKPPSKYLVFLFVFVNVPSIFYFQRPSCAHRTRAKQSHSWIFFGPFRPTEGGCGSHESGVDGGRCPVPDDARSLGSVVPVADLFVFVHPLLSGQESGGRYQILQHQKELYITRAEPFFFPQSWGKINQINHFPLHRRIRAKFELPSP